MGPLPTPGRKASSIVGRGMRPSCRGSMRPYATSYVTKLCLESGAVDHLDEEVVRDRVNHL